MAVSPDAGKSVHATNVHAAGATDALPAGPTEGQGRVDLILDLQQGVQHHGTTPGEMRQVK